MEALRSNGNSQRRNDFQSPRLSISEVKVQSEKLKLKKEFGVIYGMAVIVGVVIGSGIFISPQAVLADAGSPGLTLIVWLFGGVYALLGSLISTEIGLQIPVSGEKYAYLCELYNPYFGVLYLWQYLLILRPGGGALKLIIFGRYILKPIYRDCEVPQLAILTVSSALSCFVSLLNCLRVKMVARGQSLMSSLTVITLVILIGFGIYHAAMDGSLENLHEPFKDSCTDPTCFVMAFYGTAYSYIGWSALNFLVEELHNPARTLPTAVILSSLLVTVLYVLVNFAYLAILDKSEAISSQAIAISIAMKYSTFGGWVISILIGLAAYTSYNSSQIVAARLAFVGGRNGHLPKSLSYINIKYVSPIVSVIVISLLSMLYSWMFEVKYLLNNITFSSLASELLVSVGYLYRRIKLRNEECREVNKFKMPLAIHVIYNVLLFIFTLIPLITNFVASALLFFAVVLCSTIYYQVYVKGRLLSCKWATCASDRTNLFIQKLLYCAPEEKDD